MADLSNVLGLALQYERRGAGRDAQRLNPRQSVDDLLGDSVGEVLVIRIGADVHEGQHGDRLRLRGRTRRRRVELRTRAGPAQRMGEGSHGRVAVFWIW